MERSVIARAKTVQDAVEQALSLLDATKQQVSIEVMESEAKGMLGLYSKQAVVKVTLKTEEISDEVADISEPPQSISVAEAIANIQSSQVEHSVISTSINDAEGKAWIEDGQIQFHSQMHQQPSITTTDNVSLWINDVLITTGETVKLSATDLIRYEVEDKVVEPVWHLHIDDKAMKVNLHIEVGYIIIRKIISAQPTLRLVLRAEEEKQYIPIEPIAIRKQLVEQKVIYGLDHDEIKRACATTVNGTFVIGEGKSPVAGTNGHFEIKVDTKTRKVQPKMRDNGTIDYREIKEFPCVDDGDLIGLIHPPVPGVNGVNIFGEPILAPPVTGVIVLTSHDVHLSEDGLEVIAARTGMPEVIIQGRHVKVAIIPKLDHRGDVTLQTGNIHFQGDVEISGTVQDTMKVEADGNIHIKGNVNMAEIIATQSLLVTANVIGSEIAVGQLFLFYGQAEPILQVLLEQTEFLTTAIEQLNRAAAFKITDIDQHGLAPLLDVLFRGRFKELHQQLQLFIRTTEEHKALMNEEWQKYIKEIKNGFLNVAMSHFKTAHDLERFVKRTAYLLERVVLPQLDHIFAQFHYIQNSQILAGGPVQVKKGCYNTQLRCSGILEVTGFLRGGDYYAAKGMHIQEAGTIGSNSTKLTVKEDAVIHVDKLLGGTILQIGSKMHHFKEDTLNVRARLNHDRQFVW